MTEQKQKKGKGNDSINPVVAAVTGAVVGAGIVAAGAVVLKDKKNREKVKEVLTNVRDHAIDYVEDMQKQTQDKKDEIGKKLAEGKEKIEKAAEAAKDSLNSDNKTK